MADRNLSLTPREENVREVRRIPTPIHFTINAIKSHFIDNMNEVKAQFDVAEDLLEREKEDGCKMIWRSQVVLAEGLLDFFMHEVSKYCLFQMFCGNWDKSSKYASFLVPMSGVEQAMSSSDSNEWFFEYLNERFSRDVFLSAESMIIPGDQPMR